LFGIKIIQELLTTGLMHRFEMKQILEKLSNKPDMAEIEQELTATYLTRVISAFRDFPFVQVRSIIEEILYQGEDAPEGNAEGQHVREVLAKFHTCTDQQSISYWTDFFELVSTCTTTETKAYKVLTRLGGNNSWTPRAGIALKDLSAWLVPAARWFKDNSLSPPGPVDRYVLQQLPQFYNLYERVEKKYQEYKREHRWIDFEDMQLRVRDLLLTNPVLRTQIAEQFKFILVDEFQDTNLLQWEIISRLGELIQNKFFIVGDPKQSIYGFRNADVRVFNQARLEFAGRSDPDTYAGSVIFKESFRFKKNLTHFINTCFSRIIRRSDTNQWEVEYTPLITCRSDAEGGEIEFGLFEESESPDLQTGFITSRIVQIVKEGKYAPGDLAILLRSRNHLAVLEEHLRRKHIPFKTIGGIGFYQRQEIFDVFHLLRFLLNPHEDMALIGLLRSPFANISDEGLLYLAVAENGNSYWEKIIKLEQVRALPDEECRKLDHFRIQARRWLARRDRIGFSDLLREIFQQSMYRAVMRAQLQGEQLVANLEKILTLAAEFERTGLTTINDFTEYLKNLINTQVKEGEAPLALEDRLTVKVMTIHQAKGLEFPVVLLPYLEQQIRPTNPGEALMDHKLGLISAINHQGLPAGYPDQKSFCLLDLARQEHKQKELAELKRLFYVGCTRARDHLILSAASKNDKTPADTPLSWFLQAMQLQPGDLQDGNTVEREQCRIRFWRTYEESESDKSSSDYSAIHISLQQLKQSLNQGAVDAGSTSFLKPVSDHPKAELFSATQLMAFRQNPREYYRRYHLGYFEGDYETFRLASSQDDIAILKGKLLHRYLQFFPASDSDRWLFDLEISDDQLIREFREDLTRLGDKIGQSPVLQRVFSAKNFKNEVKILMPLDADFIVGTLDRIFQNETGHWEVLDYKTNRIRAGQVELLLDKYAIQIETYALLLSHLYPHQPQYVVNFYFTEPDIYHPIRFQPEAMPDIKQKFTGIISEIRQRFEPYSDI
jgi:ATP-dependent helicase/nuclease subunit A